jgi:Zn-dependent protease with chaperone function
MGLNMRMWVYVIGPSLVKLMMRVRWVSEKDEPELHQMIGELADIRHKRVRLSFAEKILEVFTTHPNMLKRIKYLAGLV